MQAAFIDIGLERTAFLHVSDIVQPADAEGSSDAPRTDSIRELVGEGADILVQVLKDPLGTKGARLTTFITIPSRYLVYMPFGHGVGVSARVENEAERQRLREAVSSATPPGATGGYIVRTAAEGAAHEALAADMLFLRKLWEVLTEKARLAGQGTLVHEDLPLPLRLMRDLMGEGIDRVLVDNERSCDAMRDFAATFMPGLGARVERYTGSRPLFDLHGVEEEIQRSLDRKVALKSGGYLVIDQTEALTTIDVNTGAYVGHRNLEETIYRTNLEAAVAIARQLRLRNLGGIIIIDFIDMGEEEHRRQVMQSLEKALAKDHAKTHFSAVSPLGLVGDDPQAHPREPGPAALHAVPRWREEQLRQDRGDRLLRDLPGDPAPGRPVRPAAAAGARAPGRDRSTARRGIGGARRARGAGRQADPPADGVSLPARPVRRRTDVTRTRGVMR